MDGISVAASIVGLLCAAAKISLGLNDFITRVKDAPKLARLVLWELADVSACLKQVQSLLLGANRVNASNQSLLMVEEIVVVLSNCVLIFSELEEVVDGIETNQSIRAGKVFNWNFKGKAVNALLSRLQSSKTSLSLMISTLTCSSLGDAQSSVSQLTDITRQLLESNQDISARLGRIESKNSNYVSTISRGSVREEMIDEDESIITVRQFKSDPPPNKNYEMSALELRSEFEYLLESSRPYQRASRRPEPSVSATSSVIQTLGWSCLSGISLAEVSNISIFELALDKDRLWNSIYYETRHGYLSIIGRGIIITIFGSTPFPFTNYSRPVNGPHYCKGCNEIVRQEEQVGHSSGNDEWHIRCIRCTSCSVLWDSKREFYKLGSLTCSDCLPKCFVCGVQSSMYPVIAGQKAFCQQCIEYGVPCEICGDRIWSHCNEGLLKGISCSHYRKLLIRRAPHMVDFFYPADHSIPASSSALTNKPLPLLPPLPENSLGWN